jgi:hypothetical protein
MVNGKSGDHAAPQNSEAMQILTLHQALMRVTGKLKELRGQS